MQLRLPILALVTLSVALAGCAESPTNGNSDNNGTTGGSDSTGGTPPASVSNAEAASLFAAAAKNVPEKFGMKMDTTKNGTTLMTVNAAFDQAAKTGIFQMTFDPSVTKEMGSGGMSGFSAGDLRDLTMYTSPAGSAVLANKTVILTPPDNNTGGPASQGGFGSITDPEDFLGELDDNFTVKSVTPTTLRGKGALKVDATVIEDDKPQDITVWLFQNPTRVARIQMTMPADADAHMEGGDMPDDMYSNMSEEDMDGMPEGYGEYDDADSSSSDSTPDPFSGATMTMDFLYDSEVKLTVPADLTRVLGLRYASDKGAFSFEPGPKTWTFQVDSEIALADVEVQVGDNETTPDWTMLLSAKTKTVEGATVTFTDVDADGKVSKGDTLVIDGGENMPPTVALKDLKTGYRVVPGLGLLLGALGIAGAALLARRK